MSPANQPHPAPTNAGGLPPWLLALAKHRGLIVPIAFVMLMVVILIPLPPPALDLLISLNISLSVIVLLTTISMGRPLEFSVFPSLLLATTMFRLVLNIASTRLILTADAGSPEEAIGVAGQVISAFGEFVAGDSLFVGVVIFLILIIVQFVVVTKGATRISEVAARFTLDAMPGKQMAIDSDLNAGLINETEARRRREDISREADFFGAMDGASKFVRGDAIAGIIITAVNIIGGFAVGTVERGWPAAQSAEVFTKLTIGDGLTSQIPSFIVSIAAALIVTRSGSKQQLGDELTGQLTSQPRGLVITAAFLALLAFSPLPTIPLLVTAAGLGALAWAMTRSSRAETAREHAEHAAAAPEPPPIEALLKVDVLELEVGYALVSLVDTQQGGDLLDRIHAIRRQMAAEAGFVMPPVRIRDNMQLEPTEYRIKVRGAEAARGHVRPARLLAMDSGLASGPIDGEPTREPAFGLDAWWIDPAMRARAESMNYTVVDPTSVVATHLTEIVRANAADLLTREEVNNLLEGLRQRTPKLVEETVPGVVKTADLQKVLQNLLRERVPIRDVETILETLGDWAPRTQDPDVLTEYVRNALRRTICEQVAAPGPDGKRTIVCVTLDPSLEDQVAAYIDRGPGGTSVTMPARVAGAIAGQVVRALEKVTAAGRLPVVVASPQVRAVVRQIVEPHLPAVVVLGYNEVASPFEVESLALVTTPKHPEPAVTAA
ncbi:MAG TPA: flagellar biosynthesis protein FlhA [Phycisphaerales bacterium]|nr:flagellar biosynthesis protein FlhA [Phycisphaerales bacterium]